MQTGRQARGHAKGAKESCQPTCVMHTACRHSSAGIKGASLPLTHGKAGLGMARASTHPRHSSAEIKGAGHPLTQGQARQGMARGSTHLRHSRLGLGASEGQHLHALSFSCRCRAHRVGTYSQGYKCMWSGLYIHMVRGREFLGRTR